MDITDKNARQKAEKHCVFVIRRGGDRINQLERYGKYVTLI